MEPERWDRITDIYPCEPSRVRRKSAPRFSTKHATATRACADKVEALVKSHERSGDFIESPAFAVAPEFPIDEAP